MDPKYNISHIFRRKRLEIKREPEYSKEIVVYNEKQMETHSKVRALPRAEIFFSTISKTERLNLSSSHVVIYRESLVPFAAYFHSLKETERVGHIISSLRHLVQATNILSSNHVYTIHYEHIGFRANGVPVIYDFQSCHDLEYLPLELHVLLYMDKHKLAGLSQDNLQQVIKGFFKCNDKTATYEEMQNYVRAFAKWTNKPTEDVRKHVVALNAKWYIYGLGCLYSTLISDLGLEEVPDELIQLILLCKTIDPATRPSMEEVLCQLDELFG